MHKPDDALLLRVIPAAFVVLWATGFVGARYAMPYAEPYTFLALRFIACIVLIGGAALWFRSPWPRGQLFRFGLITGMLIHGVYLGAVFWAVRNGFPAGFAGLIVGLQPIITALVASGLVGEKLTFTRWLGLGIGLMGVALVLWPQLRAGVGGEVLMNAAVCIFGVVAISLGTVLQKRYMGGMDMLTGTTVQYAGALALALVIAMLFETRQVTWTGELVFALIWLVLVLSVGAIFLLMFMIARGAVSEVASLFYLVPSVTALMAFALFGETLGPIQIAGMVVTSAGVALATRKWAKRRPV